MGVEDRHQVLPRVLDAEYDPHEVFGVDGVHVRAGVCVAGRVVGTGHAIRQGTGEETARLVGDLGAGVGNELLRKRSRDPEPAAHHSSEPSSSSSSSSRSRVHRSAERYFHPPSARSTTTVPPSISPATRTATAIAAPHDRPAKMPSSASRRRTPITASRLVTRTLSSSTDSSSTGGTNPSSSDRRPWTCSPGIGSAATIRTPGRRDFRKRPTPVSVPPVPRPATKTSTSGTWARISGPVVSSWARGFASLPYW